MGIKTWPESKTAFYHWQNPPCTCNTGFDPKGQLHCEADAYQGSYQKKEGATLALGMLCAAGTIFYKYSHHALLQDYPKPKNPLMLHPDDIEVGFDKYVAEKLDGFNVTDDHTLLWLLVGLI